MSVLLPGSLLKRGAEATITADEFLGRRVVVKKRDRKRYRDERLDARIIKQRIRNEVRSMAAARAAGIKVPWIYDTDLESGTIVMQYIDGQRLNSILYSLPDHGRISLERTFGGEIALLHRAGMAHGDLTTSNVIVAEGVLYFVDFSMASRHADLEHQGVDLRLLKEVYKSTHSEFEAEYAEILRGYRENGGDQAVIDKASEIDRRARYV